MSIYVERARELRGRTDIHFNCAQSVLIPFAGLCGLDEETAFNLGFNFGGGMKRGSVCGAVTGSLMVLGLCGVNDPSVLRRFHQRFAGNHGGLLNCAELVSDNAAKGGVKKPFCDGLVCECVSAVEEILKENGILS